LVSHYLYGDPASDGDSWRQTDIHSVKPDHAAAVVGLKGTNIPEINSTDAYTVLAYKDYDISLNAVFKTNISIEFTPALATLDFPLNVSDEWSMDSMVTVTGDISGFVNAVGLPADLEQQLLDSEFAQTFGATSLPITFDHFTSEDNSIVDGKIQPKYGNLTADLVCISKVTKQVNGVYREVYVIQIDEGPKFYYCPAEKFFSSAEMPLDPEMLPVELPIDVTQLTGDTAEMQMVDPATAATELASIEQYATGVENKAAGTAASNGLSDFFFKAPFIGLIMIIASIVIVALAVFMVMKKRKV
jgi:hypothetical protein